MTVNQIKRSDLRFDFVAVADEHYEVALKIAQAAEEFRAASEAAAEATCEGLLRLTSGGWLPVTTHFEQQDRKYVVLQTILDVAKALDMPSSEIARASHKGVIVLRKSQIVD